MSTQQTFASLASSGKKRQTRRDVFLAEMDRVIPWREMVALITPHYPAPRRGRPPMPLERMLRIYFVQQWFGLSDPAAEDALYDSESIRRFVGIELGEAAIPDETTILHFRHRLEAHQLTEQLFTLVRGLLDQRGLLMKSGTIVDATIIQAPSSTKNATGTRDPEMKQVRKGKEWYFGMRVDPGSSLKSATLPRARAVCVFAELSPDVRHNQIIKATLRLLATSVDLDQQLSEELWELYRRMPEVSDIQLRGIDFRRIVLGFHNASYRFPLAVCVIVFRNLLVHEQTGSVEFRDFLRDDAQMARVFEKFLRRFFAREQQAYRVRAPHFGWRATGSASDIARLPRMRTDMVLTSNRRTIVVDAKYYSRTLTEYFSRSTVHASHLYQLFAYMRHVEVLRPGRPVAGMLIYPRTTESSYHRIGADGCQAVSASGCCRDNQSGAAVGGGAAGLAATSGARDRANRSIALSRPQHQIDARALLSLTSGVD